MTLMPTLVGCRPSLEQHYENSIILQVIRYHLYVFLLVNSATLRILVTTAVLSLDIDISLSGRQGPRTDLP